MFSHENVRLEHADELASLRERQDRKGLQRRVIPAVPSVVLHPRELGSRAEGLQFQLVVVAPALPKPDRVLEGVTPPARDV